MIQTSQAWKDYARNHFIYHIKAVLTSADGTVLNLTDEDFMMGSVQIDEAISDDNTLTIGSVITNKFSCTLNNTEYKFDEFNFGGATLSIQLGIIYEDETEEWINRGVYTVEQPDSLGSTIQIVAYDLMDKMNTYYTGQSITSREIVDTNLYDSTTIMNGYYLNINNEQVESSTNYYSDYIAVTDGKYYVVGDLYGSILCYDSEYTFLGILPVTYINGLGLVISASFDGGTVSYIRKNGYTNTYATDYVKEMVGSLYDITFPKSGKSFAIELAKYCGIEVADNFWEGNDDSYGVGIPSFEHDETTTCRQVLGWVCQWYGIYGRMNEDGKLVCKRFKGQSWADAFSNTEDFFSPWGDNKLDHTTVQWNQAVNPTTGSIVSGATNAYVTDYIAVDPSLTYYIDGELYESYYPYNLIAIYTSTKEWMGYEYMQPLPNGRWTWRASSQGTRYIRFNGDANGVGYAFISSTDTYGNFVDGGYFTDNPWGVRINNGGEFLPPSTIVLSNVLNSSVSVYDVEVTGVTVSASSTTDEEEETSVTLGTDGYILTISENPLIQTINVNYVASLIYEEMKSMRFRLFNASILASPNVEAGDSCILTDYRGRVYSSFITSMTYTLNGAMDIRADAETPEGNNVQSANPTTQAMSGAVTTAVNIAKSYTDAEVQELTDYVDTELPTKQNAGLGQPTATSFDDITTAGNYWVNTTTTSENAPIANNYVVLHVIRANGNNAGVIEQIAYAYRRGTIYHREFVNNQWYAWKGVVTSANATSIHSSYTIQSQSVRRIGDIVYVTVLGRTTAQITSATSVNLIRVPYRVSQLLNRSVSINGAYYPRMRGSGTDFGQNISSTLASGITVDFDFCYYTDIAQ